MSGSGKGKGNSGKGNGNRYSQSSSRDVNFLNGWQDGQQDSGRKARKQQRKGGSKGNSRHPQGGLREQEGADAQLLFVKNLPGNVEAEALEDVFANYGKVVKVYVMSGRSAAVRACAFVKYLTGCDAALAVRALHGQFEMQPGHGPIDVKANAPGVFVENLPGDVQEDIVDYVFSFYGRVQTVHITTRHSRHGRARAFIEYNTTSEVEAARRALRDNHELLTGAARAPEAPEEDVSGPCGAPDALNCARSSASGNEHTARPCVVCMAAAPTHAFVPCGHRCVCVECSNAIVSEPAATCPICRVVIEKALRIFF